MEVESFLPLGRGCQLLALALSEADDLAVGRGDDDLALWSAAGFVKPGQASQTHTRPLHQRVRR